MKYTHYAPNAPVYLIQQDIETVRKAINQLHQEGEIVALLAPSDYEDLNPDFFFSFGQEGNKDEIGAKLYDDLRACDKTNATIILATTTSTEGVGAAIMNRLEKAAGRKWFQIIIVKFLIHHNNLVDFFNLQMNKIELN